MENEILNLIEKHFSGTLDNSALNCIFAYIEHKKYNTLMWMSGDIFLKELLQIYESYELYEKCADIINHINNYNEKYNDNIWKA